MTFVVGSIFLFLLLLLHSPESTSMIIIPSNRVFYILFFPFCSYSGNYNPNILVQISVPFSSIPLLWSNGLINPIISYSISFACSIVLGKSTKIKPSIGILLTFSSSCFKDSSLTPYAFPALAGAALFLAAAPLSAPAVT